MNQDHVILTWVFVRTVRWPRIGCTFLRRLRELLARIRAVHGLQLDLDSTEIKSNWVRIPKERARHPFLSRLTALDITALVTLYFDQLAELRCTVICVVMDKRHLIQPVTQEWLHGKAWEYL